MNIELIVRKCFIVGLVLLTINGFAQSPWDNLAKKPSTLGLEKGFVNLQSGTFDIKLVKASQTLASLKPKSDTTFDFSPQRFLQKRSGDGCYQLGDINLKIKEGATWKKFSTAAKRVEVKSLPTQGNILAAADLAITLPKEIPVKIIRYWEQENGNLILRFELENITNSSVEIGSIGVPMIFNNILEGQTLDENHAHNVFYDPYIGMDAGYLQVTRLNGKGPALLVIPQGKTPFEAYQPLLDDPTPKGITFEGFHEWMPITTAYATNEWKDATPWNKPNTLILNPGEKKSYAFKFILSPSIREIERSLVLAKRPVAVGIPGYVIAKDVDAKLFLNYHQAVQSIDVFPAGALTLKSLVQQNGLQTYQVNGKMWGRARITIQYKDGLTQTIQYKVIKPESELVADFGKFLTTQQWFDDKNDVFKRAPSVISYDYETKKQVTEDSRAWIAGLGDEAGGGSWLGGMMKQLVLPDKSEIAKMEQFVNQTIWGRLQSNLPDSTKYGVKKSLFYYEPKDMPIGTYSENVNYKTWAAWPKKEADSYGRSYNYPHVAAAHWVLYRLARYHQDLTTAQQWNWYLDNAYETTLAMMKLAPYYAQFGQMEGSVFLYILKDLKNEGLTEKANILEAAMKKRADHWRSLNYPFGSEMPWDSTGQEEVYLWSNYFGYQDKADITLSAILGYMPTIPHWGYNGSARRYWDFLYGGKLSRVERQLHHYGSGLNAIPVLTEFRQNPNDLYLLRVGYGGLLGAIANVTEDGFGPSAFHSYPSTLKIDGLSGDYGPNFYGYAVNSATYIVQDKMYGLLAFGGNLKVFKNVINVNITTASKQKIFIASAGLWLTLDAGTFKNVSYDQAAKEITLVLNQKDEFTPNAYLNVVQNGAKKYNLKQQFQKRGEAFIVPLHNGTTKVVLKQSF
ncbi:MAG: hypothetical protein EOP00_01375 [Pedobacter sp.]|nr:MAG: hypothetical protein EOP00_01375 [Pedobacter sp.]